MIRNFVFRGKFRNPRVLPKFEEHKDKEVPSLEEKDQSSIKGVNNQTNKSKHNKLTDKRLERIQKVRKRTIYLLIFFVSSFLFVIFLVIYFATGGSEGVMETDESTQQSNENLPEDTQSTETTEEYFERVGITPGPLDLGEEYEQQDQETFPNEERNFVILDELSLEINTRIKEKTELSFYNSTNRTIILAFSNGVVLNIEPKKQDGLVFPSKGRYIFEQRNSGVSTRISGRVEVI